jgi:hypothetical protein
LGGGVLHVRGRAVGGQDILLGSAQRAQVHLRGLARRGGGEHHHASGRPGGVHGLAERLAAHGREKRHVGAAALREAADLRGDVPGGDHGGGRAQRAGRLQPVREHVRHHGLRPGPPHELHQDEADRALAHHQHGLALLHARLAHGLQAGVDGLHEAGLFGEDPVGHGDGATVHDPVEGLDVLREAAAGRLEAGGGAVALVARALRVGARPAEEARAAGHVVVDDHALALTKADDALPRARHPARDLVAEDPRPGQKALLDLLDVGPADAAGLHPDQQLAGTDLRHRDVLHRQTARRAIDGGLHPPSRLRSTKKTFSFRSRRRR